MIHIFEATVFIGYSFLAPIITAGGGMIISSILNLGGINLIQATGLASSFSFVNGIIGAYAFSRHVVWQEVRNILPITIIGSFIGSMFLVKMNPVILLSLMFIFSVYYIYKKLQTPDTKTIQENSFWKQQCI